MTFGQSRSRAKQRSKASAVESPRPFPERNQRPTPGLLLQRNGEESLNQGLALKKVER